MSKFETIVLGGGCFWCIEAIFQRVKGIQEVISGYAGGDIENPTYRQVCSGNTGHAEVVKITFEPKKISLSEILEIFWIIHDPTTLNRQGADVGSQYRSIILFLDKKHEKISLKSIQNLEKNKVYNKPIVTEVKPLGKFYIAENYHQNYFNNHSQQPYCQVIINPKLNKFKEKFNKILKN